MSLSPGLLYLLEFNFPGHGRDVGLLLVVLEDEQGPDEQQDQEDQGEAEEDGEYVKYLTQFPLEPALWNIVRRTLPNWPVNVGNILQVQSFNHHSRREANTLIKVNYVDCAGTHLEAVICSVIDSHHLELSGATRQV